MGQDRYSGLGDDIGGILAGAGTAAIGCMMMAGVMSTAGADPQVMQVIGGVLAGGGVGGMMVSRGAADMVCDIYKFAKEFVIDGVKGLFAPKTKEGTVHEK